MSMLRSQPTSCRTRTQVLDCTADLLTVPACLWLLHPCLPMRRNVVLLEEPHTRTRDPSWSVRAHVGDHPRCCAAVLSLAARHAVIGEYGVLCRRRIEPCDMLADHYQGLSENWSAGPVYCSEVTGKLAMHLCGVPPHYIRTLPMHRPVMVQGDNCDIVGSPEQAHTNTLCPRVRRHLLI